MISFISGDLFNNNLDLNALAHGVNTMGVMGAGIAVQFRKRYPEMYEEYRKVCKLHNPIPGNLYPWTEPDGTVIFNLFTQAYDCAKILPATYQAIEDSLVTMINIAELNPLIQRLGMPQIGCGLGGLDWVNVKRIMQEVCEPSYINVKVFETYEPNKQRGFLRAV